MPTDSKPPVFSIYSVVKNVVSRERMFRRAIESVLRQTFGDFEYVIQDGGSTDRTAEIVAEYADPRIKFVSVPDSCGEEGFFRSLMRCRGKYVGSCLSDEELYPDALQNAYQAWEAHPHVAAFYGNVSYVNEHGQKWGPRIPPHPFSIEAYVCQELVPPFCSSFFRRDAIEKAGLREHHWRYRIGEFEFWIRLADVGEIIYLPLNISYFGRHSQSHTRSVKIYDEMLAERERALPHLFRENRILRDCGVTVEQALAGNFVWGATSVFNIEGASERCLSFMRKAERYAPEYPPLAKLKARIQGKPMIEPTPKKPSSTVPSAATFGQWIDTLAAMDNRLYYRDQSPETLTSLCSLAQEFDPTVIVELGTLGGLSLRTWLAVGDRARVTAIDLSFAKLAQTRRVLPVDLSRVTLLEQDILKVDFSKLWTAQDRVVLFVDAHDLPNVPIMQHVLTNALPSLPDGSLVIVDDLWFSEQTLTTDGARAFLDNRVVGEIDELQCFKGYFAPYHAGGSFMGFAEVLPLLDFVNRYGIELKHERGGKHAYFTWNRACLSPGMQRNQWIEPDGCRGMVPHNPLASVSVSGPAREVFQQVVDAYPQGKTRQIAEYLRQLVAEYPGESGLRYAYAVVLARLGMLVQARDVLAAGAPDVTHRRYQRLFDDLTQYVGPCELPQSRQPQTTADERGLTIFALPKPFAGDIATIQRNAIRSWTRLSPRPEIILFGDEPGTREMAAEVGARHVSQIECNEFGTPLVDKFFQAAQDIASNPVVAYVNADMILFQDFIDGVQKVQTRLPEFLLIGQRWDLPVLEEIDFARSDWQARLQREMQEHAMIHPESGLDYFVFRRGLWPAIPSFALGRTAWDNWLVMDPSRRGVPVVDGTEYITAVHQDHDYGHMAGGREEAWKGTEAQRNRALAGETDGSGRTSGARYILNKDGNVVATEPREPWCNTVVYRDQRSAWLIAQATRLVGLGKPSLAACKCEEALGGLRVLLPRALRRRDPAKLLDPEAVAQRYVNCHTLLAQCYLKAERYDLVADAYTRLLENPFVQLPAGAREEILRLRDQSACIVQRKRAEPPAAPRSGGEEIAPAPRRGAPQVSVILACHNAEEFLPECLDSILAQTLPSWELHLLDDGSSDRTRSIMADYAGRDDRIITYYYDDNAGPYVRRNFAIEHAATPFIVIQDADDVMCPDKLERLYHAIAQDKRLGIVGSFYRMFLDQYQGADHAEDVRLKTEHAEIIADYRNSGICDYSWHGSAIIRKRLFEDIGPYDNNPFSSDSFWLAKVAEYAWRTNEIQLKNIPEFLTLRRMRADSQTGSLPSFDPRGRRAMFRAYRRDKLSEMIRRLDSDPTVDVKAELRRGVCDDFLEKHRHLFDSWESRPLTNHMVDQFVGRVYSQFGLGQFARCINTCGIVDRLVEGIAQVVRGYDLVRGLAYFVLGFPERSREYLEREWQVHGTELARWFCAQHLERYDSHSTRARRASAVRESIFGSEMLRSQPLDQTAPAPIAQRRTGPVEVSIVLEHKGDAALWMSKIAALKAQTDSRFELIAICSDRSAEQLSAAIDAGAADFLVLAVGERTGRATCRNAAAQHARGKYVAFLGEWIVPEPDFVQTVIRCFEQDDINALRGRIVLDSGVTPADFDLGPEWVYAACDTDETCAFRKDIFDQLGGFTQTLFDRDAIRLSYRIYTDPAIPARPILYCPEVVTRYVGPPPASAVAVDRHVMANFFSIDFLKLAGHVQNNDTSNALLFFRFVSSLYAGPRQTEDDRYEQRLSETTFFGERFPQIALERAQAVLSGRPESMPAKYIVGSLLARLGQPERACGLLEDILTSLEGLVALGRVDRARSEFSEYADVCDCYQATCKILAQCYVQAGRHREVASIYRRLLGNPHLCIPEAQKQEMLRVCERLAEVSPDRTPAVHGTSAASMAFEPTATAEVQVSLMAEAVSAQADEETSGGHRDVLAELEARYRAMPDDAPGKVTTALRLSELCRRLGQATKGQTFALAASQIKGAASRSAARHGKPRICAHKPSIVEFNVIRRCTAGCIMCNYSPQGDILELDQFKRIADELLPTARRVVLIGGEVLLHPDFYAMCEHVRRFDVSLEMTTNLCTLAGDRTEAVGRFFSSVKVSIDAATKQTYESIRTRLSWDRLQENLGTLARIKRQRPDLRLQLAFVAMRQNIAELPDAIGMVARHGFDSVSVSFAHLDGRLALDDLLLFHREQANRYFDQARQRAGALGMRLDIPNNFDLSRSPFLSPEKPTEGHKQCVRPWQRVRVLTDGEVIPCCRLHSQPMGNVISESFERIWNGLGYQRLREAIAGSSVHMPSECRHCELINGPTDSNDVLLHAGRDRAGELQQRFSADGPEPQTQPARTSDHSIRPKVTIVTACHNAELYLAESLDSILSQSLTEWELFLLDDASTDSTRAIMAEYAGRDRRIRTFMFDTNAGPYVRRNFAIAQANSDFIVIHDSDDLMAPNKLERLYETINSDRRLAIVGSWYRTFFERFKDVRYTDPIDLSLDHETISGYARSWKHGVSHGAAIIRKSMFERIGGYDGNPFSSDAFWSAKLAEYAQHSDDARFMNIAEYLTLYRVHSVSQTQVLSTFDPRNRRVRFRGYCQAKLARIREKVETVPGTDIARELRECNCSDFLTRFKAQIITWENEPLDQNVLAGLLRGAVEAFNGGCYVSCMSVLNGAEIMDPMISQRIVGFNLLRGMALFAIEVAEKSSAFLEQEIDSHNSQAARAFMTDAFERNMVSSVPDWCANNIGRYDLGLSVAPMKASRLETPVVGMMGK